MIQSVILKNWEAFDGNIYHTLGGEENGGKSVSKGAIVSFTLQPPFKALRVVRIMA
jgi:hypothetical protein